MPEGRFAKLDPVDRPVKLETPWYPDNDGPSKEVSKSTTALEHYQE